MTLKEYIPLAIRTEATALDDTEKRLLHAAIGLATEAGELLSGGDTVNAKEELGDLCWYVAVALDAFGIRDIYHVRQRDGTRECIIRSITIVSSEALDKMKKVAFYNASVTEYASAILADISEVYSNISSLCRMMGFGIEDVLAANIAKLRVRYPDAFNQQRALDRNLSAERKALEA